jgi:hypothetical protein
VVENVDLFHAISLEVADGIRGAGDSDRSRANARPKQEQLFQQVSAIPLQDVPSPSSGLAEWQSECRAVAKEYITLLEKPAR